MDGVTSAPDPADQGGNSQRYREVRRVTLVGSLVDLVLGVAKLVFGSIAQSQALIADGVHSLSDLVTDAVVLFAAREAHREADAEHPYGHARIETVATVVLGVSLLVVAAGIALDAIRRMFEPSLLLEPTLLALVVAGFSVVLKEFIYHYTMRTARRLRSELLKANAWHSRADAISSLFVLVGVAGSLAGLPYVDAVAAVAVAVMVGRIGVRLVRSNFGELIDAGLEPARLEAIRDNILQIDGVGALHSLRTRLMGGHALVDVHILLENPKLSVSEGHQISETVRAALLANIEEVSDVMVHIDPEDDEDSVPNESLPLRNRVLSEMERLWADTPEAALVRDIRLHYLSGQVHPEIVVAAPDRDIDSAQVARLCDALRRPLAGQRWFADPIILFQSSDSRAP